MTNKIFIQQVNQYVLYVILIVLVIFTAAFKLGDSPVQKTINNLPADSHLLSDSIPFNFVTTDKNKRTQNAVTGHYLQNENGFTFSLDDTLVLNYKKWKVTAGHQIIYSLKGIAVNGLVLTHDSASVTIAGTGAGLNNPVNITLQNFDTRDLAGLLKTDTLNIGGLLKANLMVSDFEKKLPAITGSATLNNFSWMRQRLGNLELNMEKAGADIVHTILTITGDSTNLKLSGDYFLNSLQQQLAMVLNIKTLPAQILRGLTKVAVSNVVGNVSGDIALGGTVKQPQWNGQINIDSAAFRLDQWGSNFSITNQPIRLNYPFISLNNFTVKDSLAHPFILDGNLCFNALKNYDLNLHITSADFTLLNATKAINNTGYGYSGINANLSITGNSKKPVIKGDIFLTDKTSVTIVLPEKNTDRDASRSVVSFINHNNPALSSNNLSNQPLATVTDFRKYLVDSVAVHAGSSVALDIIIDPTNGDELKVQGNALLKAGVLPGGGLLLAGLYNLDTGYYELNYQFLKRRFNLLKGSTLYFAGGPADAQVNIKAEYVASTSAKDLLSNEVGSVAPAIARSFNQKLPFSVILSLKGPLKNPEISFEIRMPQNLVINKQLRTTIENKLVQLKTDVAATNKQVFAILALDRFVGEQSTDFFKGNGSDFSGIANESVSKFLAAALDQFASDLFKGINVDLNLNSYKDFSANNGTQHTDLKVEISKNFLDDRLNVTVGKNFGIEGQDGSAKAAQQKSSRFLPDVTVNYKLSSDGRYMLRAYNKDPFEVILDGYIIETGLAFIVTMDYDKFDELFLKRSKRPNP